MTQFSLRRLVGQIPSVEFSRWIETILEWQKLARQRRDLAALDDRALHDLGLGRSDIEMEISKPFWRR